MDYGHLPPSRRLGYRIPHSHLTDQVAVRICKYTYRTNSLSWGYRYFFQQYHNTSSIFPFCSRKVPNLFLFYSRFVPVLFPLFRCRPQSREIRGEFRGYNSFALRYDHKLQQTLNKPLHQHP